MKKPPKIIAICSPRPQCGKSTVCRIIQDELGYKRIPFAEPLKLMCRPLFKALGYDDARIARFENGDKTDLVIGRTVRHWYQTLGTEWGRDCIDKDLWTLAWRGAVRTAFEEGWPGVVADDIRFSNELAAVDKEKGRLWRVTRQAAPDLESYHSSEGQLNHVAANLTIDNDYETADELREALMPVLFPR
jgi:hypothetical protein